MLPKTHKPKFKLTVPSTNKKVTFRPYTVGEEKILFMAKETEDIENIIESVNNVIEECFEGVDSNELTYFDFEYLYLKLNMASSGEEKKLMIECSECGTSQPMDINLEDITISDDKNEKNNIDITDEIGVTLRYPSMLEVLKNADDILSLIKVSIVNIYDSENVYDVKDISPKELNEWVNELENVHINKLAKFFFNAPKLNLTKSSDCLKCGGKGTVKFTSNTFDDFFTYP